MPHYLLFVCSHDKDRIGIDIASWIKCLQKTSVNKFLDLTYLMIFVEEYRNLFYLRTGKWSAPFRYLKKAPTLFISTPSKNFGEGTFIQHGFATVIAANKIGKYCWINQQVTIGYNDSKKYGFGNPTLGDHVRVSCGAKVLGNITIGDGSTIGVNAVVVKNVPPDSTVIPSPTMMIVEEGNKVYKKL